MNAVVCDTFERSAIGGGPVSWVSETTRGSLGIANGALVASLPGDADGDYSRVRDGMPEALPEGSHVVTVMLGFSYAASTTLSSGSSSDSYVDLMLVNFTDDNGGAGFANVALSPDGLVDVDYDLGGATLEVQAAPGAVHELRYTIPFGGGSAEVTLDGKLVLTMPLAYAGLQRGATVELMVGPDEVHRKGPVAARYEYVAVTVSP
jgi:hypothetical protein